ncbi:RNA polymerase II subunit A C-terminal domain phosphatase [Echinococcus granulosus]|nr:RNA polymerase II subunit A C-terminal domain phosphatase [Echinococcus granulosus]
MNIPDQIVKVPEDYESVKVVKVKVKKRQAVTPSTIVCTLEAPGHPEMSINGPGYGKVTMLCQEGCTLGPNQPLFKYEGCGHHVVMRDLCAECGANLRKEGGVCGERISAASASIPMVHMIPDLHVSESVAAEIALKDEESLLTARKLALLIDLDQTVLHTTTTPHAFRYKNVHRFNLAGCEMMYHTRFRPHLGKFLRRMVKRFQMHICTFGNRAYAHQLASILDPKRKYFCQRILSRDECFNPVTKSANLRHAALFPRGVHLVCIIDDRGDVWDWSPNLIQVQPYRFFPEVGDINGPPGRPLSMMPMPDFRAFNPPSPTGTSTSTDTSNSSDEEGPSSSNIPKLGALGIDLKPADKTIETSLDHPTSPSKNVEEMVPSGSLPEPSKSTEKSPAFMGQCAPLKLVESKELSESPKCTDYEAETKSPTEFSKSVEEEVRLKPLAENALIKDKAEVVEEVLDYPPLCESPPPPPLSPIQSIFEMNEEALDAFDSDYLLRLEEILTEIHRRYYRAYDKYMAEVKQRKAHNIPVEEGSRLSGIPHVANVMSQMRARVLGPNTHITLSGLTPRNRPARDSLAGQIALGLGATLHNRLRLPKQPLVAHSRAAGHRAFTTHLVACRQNTEKVMAARNFQAQCATNPSQPPLIHIVSPRWLWASHFRWQRLPESQFPLDHEYSVHAFDPDANSPTAFHGRSRHRHHQHHRRRHHQYRLPLQHHHPFMRDDTEAVMEVANLSEKQELSSSMVRSAIESIKQELRDRHGHHRSHEGAQMERKHKRTVSESTELSGTPATKRPCLRKSDGHLSLAVLEELDLLEEHSTSPSLSTTDEEDVNYGDDKKGDGKEEEGDGKEMAEIEMERLPLSPTDVEDNPDNVAIISDSDEEGLDSTLGEDDDDNDDDDIDIDEEDEEGKEVEEQETREVNDKPGGQSKLSVSATTETDLQEEMKQYLPPPCPLEYAENPLLHMSPQAASQMLDEVEEAVMEEREERAASVPREMEDEVSSSSSSNSSDHNGRGKRGPEDDDEELEENDDEDEDDSQVEGRVATQRDLEQEGRWLRIRQQLLLRRSGANRRALAKIERRLWEISRSGSVGSRFSVEMARGRQHQELHHHHHRRNRYLSTDPSSRLSDELTDLREFNTCPEGYDYMDAERARELLRPETARQEVRFDSRRQVGHGGEGSDNEGADGGRTRRKKSRKKKKKSVIGAAGYLEASLFGSDVSSSSSSPSSTNSDDCEGGGDEDGIIRSDALKEFM